MIINANPENMVSQYGECFILEALYKNQKGFFVDIGAADGVRYSNTLKLAKNGWKGIMVEPCAHFITALENNYKEYRDVKLYRGAVSDSNGTAVLHVWNTGDESQISTISEKQFNGINSDDYWKQHGKFTAHYEVNTITPEKLLLDYDAPQYINFVDIDAEGSEMSILESWPWEKYNVELFCIETTPGVEVLLEYFNTKKYTPLLKTGGNLMFVKKGDYVRMQNILTEAFQ